MPPLYYFHHSGLLVCAMHIVLQNQISSALVQAAQDMLDDFYLLLPELYGNQICVLNMHLLSHMVNFVRLWGPLWTHSAFRFESMNGHITGMIHSRYNIAKQLLFSIDVATTMSVLADKLKSVEDEETLSYLTFRIYLIEICHCSFSERIQLAYYILIYLLPMNVRPLIDARE